MDVKKKLLRHLFMPKVFILEIYSLRELAKKVFI
jgi:hypothetical protein